MTLTFDLLTLKVVSESRVTWATSVPILVFLGFSVLDLGPMHVTDRQTDVRQHYCLMPTPRGGGHNNVLAKQHFVLTDFVLTVRVVHQAALVSDAYYCSALSQTPASSG